MILAKFFGCWAVLSIFGLECLAQQSDLNETVLKMQSRIEELEEKVGEQERYIKEKLAEAGSKEARMGQYEEKLSQFDEKLHRQTVSPQEIGRDLELGAGATFIIQGASNANADADPSEKSPSRTDGSYSADITILKELRGLDGGIFLHLESGQGSGLEDNLSVYSNVNRDADNDNNFRLTEAWYEQALIGQTAVVTFGKLDPTAYFDNNEAANDETTQFLSKIFRNSPVIEFPDNTAGARFAYLPLEWMELSYGVFDANSDWEKITDNLFNIAQVSFKGEIFDRLGNYRFLAWHSNAYHTKWLETESAKEDSYGLGLSFDQGINDIITLFVRAGWQNPKVYNPDITATGDLEFSLESSYSAGFQAQGSAWGRDHDVFGFALGEAVASDEYKQATGRLGKNEGHVEAYYRIFIHEHLCLSPGIQYIWNAFGKDAANSKNSILIAGFRTQLDF